MASGLRDLRELAKVDPRARQEVAFWESLTSTLVGNCVNKGLEKEELVEGLRSLRNRSLGGLLFINAIWLSLLSYFYMGTDSTLSRLNIYGVISGVLYGFTLAVQIVGLTASRVQQVVARAARFVYGEEVPVYVHKRE